MTTTKTTPATFKLNDGTVVIANPETREPLRYVVRAQADARRAKLLAEGIAAEVIQPGFGRVFYLRHGLDFDLTDDGTQDEIDDEIDEMGQACDKAGLVFDEDYTVLYGAAWAITGIRAFTARAVAVIEEA